MPTVTPFHFTLSSADRGSWYEAQFLSTGELEAMGATSDTTLPQQGANGLPLGAHSPGAVVRWGETQQMNESRQAMTVWTRGHRSMSKKWTGRRHTDR